MPTKKNEWTNIIWIKKSRKIILIFNTIHFFQLIDSSKLGGAGGALGSSRFWGNGRVEQMVLSSESDRWARYVPVSENLCIIILLNFKELTIQQRNLNPPRTYQVNSLSLSLRPMCMHTHQSALITDLLLTWTQKRETFHTVAVSKDIYFKSIQHVVRTQQMLSLSSTWETDKKVNTYCWVKDFL